jgi:hypothetical protein
MHLACTFSTSKKAAERVVDLGVITAPLGYADSLTVVSNRRKKKMTDAVSITTYAGVHHMRFSNLNCTIAAKVDDFDAMPGLSEKYHEDMRNPDTVIGTSMHLHVCSSKSLVLKS